MYYSQYDVEGGQAFDYAAFSEKTLRMGFLRKVFGILFVQLVLTFVIAFFMQGAAVASFFAIHPAMYVVTYVVMIVTMLTILCCENARRQVPTNYILLFLFTAAEGILVGAVCIQYKTSTVLLAVLFTAAVVFALTLFAFQTSIDFTVCGGAVVAGATIMLVFGLVLLVFPGLYNGGVVQLVYGSLGALVVALYIVYDVQLMIGGSHKYEIGLDDYVFAALNLYVDIVLMFQYILQIVSALGGDN